MGYGHVEVVVAPPKKGTSHILVKEYRFHGSDRDVGMCKDGTGDGGSRRELNDNLTVPEDSGLLQRDYSHQ